MATSLVPIAERIDADSLFAGDRTLFSLSVPADQVPLRRLSTKHRRVFEYWKGKRGTRFTPRRADIDPCDLGYALPDLILWEFDGFPDYRVRLAGTEICRNMLGELRGVALHEIRCPLIAEARAEFDAARDHGHVSIVERTLHWLGRPLAYYRHLLLPLADGHDRVYRLLSVMTFESIAEWHQNHDGEQDFPGGNWRG
jgi:hypothetical protein